MKTMAEWIAEKTARFPDTGSIPVDQAGICWDVQRTRDYSGPILDLHVVDLRRAEEPGTFEERVWDVAGSTAGACMTEWGKERNPRYTPLGKFSELCFDGNMPKGHHFVRVLTEFAKIEGCDWALQMLAALHMGEFLTDNDEEHSLG